MSRLKLALCVALLGVVVTAAVAVAGGRSQFRADLSGFEEVPFVSTEGSGRFRAMLDRDAQTIHYRLDYDVEGDVQQAHIHLGQRLANGGISVFLCTNLGNGPAGTQACPAAPNTVSGEIRAADVVGPAGQGLAAGEFEELLRAMRAGATYANVHTTLVPAGEIRGQIDRGHRDED